MNISASALKAPTKDSLEGWLSTPRLAKCGVFFTPDEAMWWPDRSFNNGVNWKTAILCVSSDQQCWLHAVLAYYMSEVKQGTVSVVASIFTRAAQVELDPLYEDHLISLRERFTRSEFATLTSFIRFWKDCESLEQRPSQALLDAYEAVPKKKQVNSNIILSLDPEHGPFTQIEQDSLCFWAHDQFGHGNLEPERYLYLRLVMVYGQRGAQLRMMTFQDFIKNDKSFQIRIFWAKQKDVDAGWREKSETFNLDEDLYNLVQAYKSIVLAQLKSEYAGRANWIEIIENVPLFRRKKGGGCGQSSNLVDLSDMPVLEQGPQPQFHASAVSIRMWLSRMENMPGFPISSRTQRPLKISRAHRFRHTLGTDLSNAGLDEWSIAAALMHTNTRTVRQYRAISSELMKLIDEKMSDHLALVVNAFSGTIVACHASAKNGDRVDRQIEDLAICGADESCHLDAPFSCYGCSKFQPLLEADHSSALERLERRRAQTIAVDKTTGVLWDRAILSCRKIILDCKALQESSKALGSDE